jgi:teichuronic acid biosynthesis glycosyltransferase TuaC
LTVRRRLLFIASDFPNPCDPCQGTFNGHMLDALSGLMDVEVVCPVGWLAEAKARLQGKPRFARSAQQRGVPVHYPRYYYTPRILRQFYGEFLWFSVRKTIDRLMSEAPPDVVMGYWAHPDGAVAVRAARRAGLPSVVMVGGSDVLLLANQPARRRCILAVLQEADRVITVGQHLKARLIDLGVIRDKLHVVERGVDTTLFHPGERRAARHRLGIEEDGRVLVWVGRMVPVKGLDVLLSACHRLAARGLAFRLFLIGDGELRPALEAECRLRGLADAVRFTGVVGQEQLPDWYRAADLTVLPSRSEGIPNVLRESLACGTPFVASRVGGIPEIAPAGHCRLVPPEDADRLADAIRQSLEQPPPDDLMEFVQSSWDESAKELFAVLEPLLGRDRQSLRPGQHDRDRWRDSRRDLANVTSTCGQESR